MKKIIYLIILTVSLFGYSQNPNLKLQNKIDAHLNIPKKLVKNEICLIYEINGGSTAYNRIIYYFVTEKGNIDIYKEERPKPYLKNEKLKSTIVKVDTTNEMNDKIIHVINSKELNELLKYSQKDFRKIIPELKNLPPSCMITDHNEYKLIFIQNNKQSSYSYYYPKYFYETCNDKRINKPVLKKFINVLDLF